MAAGAIASEIQEIAGRPRLSFLEGLRGIAALYVMFHHMSRQLWPGPGFQGSVPPVGYQRLITVPLAYGHLAVDLFIVLSGFCLMLPVIRAGGRLRAGTWGFLRRRARRILPPYYAALLLSLVLIRLLISTQTGTPWDHSVPVTAAGLLTHLFMVHDVYTSHFQVWKQIDHPLWSVALEFQIYLIFPPLVWLWNRIGGIAATAVAVFAVGLGSFALHFSPVKILFFDYIALFCLGVAACAAATSDIAPWPAIRRRVPWRSITLLAFAALVLLNIFFNEADRAALLCEPLVGIFSAALLVTLSISPRSLLRNCVQWKPIVFVGTFSYSLYLIHAPLIQLIWQYALKPAHLGPVTVFFLLLSVGSVIILGISYGFFILCERPFLIPARSSARADLPAVPAI